MRLSIIAAMERNRLIGRNGTLPWRLSADLKHFKEITMGKPVIMGRKTHESIGRPLPYRENVVLTRDPGFIAEGCTVMTSLDDIYQQFSHVDEIMIMGGADLYRQTLHRANRMYLTLVHAELEGDTWFPEFNLEDWHEIDRQDHTADKNNEYDYSFVILTEPG